MKKYTKLLLCSLVYITISLSVYSSLKIPIEPSQKTPLETLLSLYYAITHHDIKLLNNCLSPIGREALNNFIRHKYNAHIGKFFSSLYIKPQPPLESQVEMSIVEEKTLSYSNRDLKPSKVEMIIDLIRSSDSEGMRKRKETETISIRFERVDNIWLADIQDPQIIETIASYIFAKDTKKQIVVPGPR